MGEYNSFTGNYTADHGAEVTFSPDGITTTGQLSSSSFEAASGFEVHGDIMTTAKSPTGSPVVGREVRPSDTIETHGQRMTVAMAVQFGFLSKDFAGSFTTTSTGQAGVKPVDAPKGALELASGGTAEEALAGSFRASNEAEAAFDTIIQGVQSETQFSAIESILRNEGQLDINVLERMASQAGVEPADMADTVATAQAGMEQAVMKHLSTFGVYDQDTFTAFLHSSPQNHHRMVESVRDLVMHNSTNGFEGLAQEFTLTADMVDPANVDGALEDAGIPFTRQRNGGVVLDLSAQGLGQMAFRQAVELGIIKLSANR